MTEVSDIIHPKSKVKYVFRFGSSDKLVQLTQHQLNLIPYLSTLVAHKDDFSSIQNENGEYVLNNPIEYTWFMAILCSITSKNPYTLFNELPEDNHIMDVLQLFDYLGVQSFSLPLLKDEDLVRSNPNNSEDEKHQVKYHKADLSEVRQTAAEFVIGLGKNEYKLRDLNTKHTVFILINIILSSSAIFSSRFQHHTITIVRKSYRSFFSKIQQHQLETSHQIAQYHTTNHSMYLFDAGKPLPTNFQNTFTWRGVYVPIEDNHTNSSFATFIDRSNLITRDTSYFFPRYSFFDDIDWSFELDMTEFNIAGYYAIEDLIDTSYNREVSVEEHKQREKEAQSARSGHFNTLPKRPTVDKFKHRCGSKAQKYR